MCRYIFSGGPGNRNKAFKKLGIVLMAAGLLVLVLSLPRWVWSTFFGILLISTGYLIWRFS